MKKSQQLTKGLLEKHNAVYEFESYSEKNTLILRENETTPSEDSSEQLSECSTEYFVNYNFLRSVFDSPSYSGEDLLFGYNSKGNIALIERASGDLVLQGVCNLHKYKKDFDEFHEFLCTTCRTAKLIII